MALDANVGVQKSQTNGVHELKIKFLKLYYLVLSPRNAKFVDLAFQDGNCYLLICNNVNTFATALTGHLELSTG